LLINKNVNIHNENLTFLILVLFTTIIYSNSIILKENLMNILINQQ